MTDLATNPHTLKLTSLNEPAVVAPYTFSNSIHNKDEDQID